MAVATLAMLGYGPVEPAGTLNVFARLSALAAGTLAAQGDARHLLITGGRTGGEGLPSEAALMAAYLKQLFGLSSSFVTLEEQARDTLENIVYTCNLLDRKGFNGSLGFLALQMHLPRIRYIADLAGLEGETFAVEPLVVTRSERHRRFLDHLKGTPAYTQLAASQIRAMRGLQTLPAFWLPPLAGLENAERLRCVQAHPAVRPLGLPEDLAAFQNTLRSMPRRFPKPHPGDEKQALELLHA